MRFQAPEQGMIVESLQGRDKGCLYAVSEVLQGGLIMVVDGKKRTLSSPKKKNIKHVRLTARNLSEDGITAPWDKASDNRIARFLKTLNDGTADKS